jgi:hypothetical protein
VTAGAGRVRLHRARAAEDRDRQPVRPGERACARRVIDAKVAVATGTSDDLRGVDERG